MNTISIYVTIGIIAGLAIAMNLILFYNRQDKGLSRLAGLAFAFVIAGFFLTGQQLVGYILIGVGVILILIDITQHSKTKAHY